jgi:hypothetical protein
MARALILVMLLAGCGATPEQLLTGFGGAGIASIAIIHRSPFDAVYSIVSGRDCSIVRLDRDESYCRPVDPPPEPPRYCTRSLGVVDCWADPTDVPGQRRGVADGPRMLTSEQEAYRTRTWP